MLSKVQLAATLFENGVVGIQEDEPLMHNSGLPAPMYVDLRVLLSKPEACHEVTKLLRAAAIKLGDIEGITAVAPAGIPWGAFLSHELGVPLVYVRLRRKPHGTKNKIEGTLGPGSKVIILDDMVTSGSSIIQTSNAVRGAGHIPIGAMAIFSFQLDRTNKGFQKSGLKFTPLITFNELLDVGIEKKFISMDTAVNLKEWAKAPARWRHRKG